MYPAVAPRQVVTTVIVALALATGGANLAAVDAGDPQPAPALTSAPSAAIAEAGDDQPWD